MYDLIPRPLVQSVAEPDGKVTLLQPKLRNRFALKVFAPRIKDPNYHIHLDELGSAVWKKIDGVKNAGYISEELNREFGDKYENLDERFGKFLSLLQKANFIKL